MTFSHNSYRVCWLIVVRLLPTHTVECGERMSTVPKEEIRRSLSQFGNEGCNAGNPADLKRLLAQYNAPNTSQVTDTQLNA